MGHPVRFRPSKRRKLTGLSPGVTLYTAATADVGAEPITATIAEAVTAAAAGAVRTTDTVLVTEKDQTIRGAAYSCSLGGGG